MSNEVFFESNKTSIMLEGLLRQCESFDQFEQICSDDMLNSDCRTSIYLMRLLDKYGWKTSAASEAAEMSTGYLGLIINGKKCNQRYADPGGHCDWCNGRRNRLSSEVFRI